MTDNELLEKSALEAIRSAAEKLNVDPMRFARFLQQGRIAGHPLGARSRRGDGRHRAAMTAMTQEYLDFLEDEMRLCRDQLRPWGADPPNRVRLPPHPHPSASEPGRPVPLRRIVQEEAFGLFIATPSTFWCVDRRSPP
jgi:hypothetical protein